MLSEYIHSRWQFLRLGTAMQVLRYLLNDGRTGYALIATVASFALMPWFWLILVW